MSNQSQEDGEKWKAKLNTPLPGGEEVDDRDDEMAQLAQFNIS